MRAFMETGFYLIYIGFTVTFAILMIIKSKQNKSFLFFAVACLILVFGDVFHLVPRSIGLFTGTLDQPSKELASDLGYGKLITSITMTIFYVLLYWFIYEFTGKKHNRYVDLAVILLLLTRVLFCAFKQNGWEDNSYNFTWAFLRNIPFLALGIIVIILCIEKLKNKRYLQYLWILISLSFAFYLPVVFFANAHSWVGFFMLPKTICYMLITLCGYLELKRCKGEQE